MRKFVLAIATGFGSGYFPIFPGTIGSLVGIILFILFRQVPYIVIYLLNVAVIIFLGVWASKNVAHYLQQEDPQIIVIDEIAGQLITLIPFYFFQFNLYYVGGGFLIFRLFDIFKPYPIRKLETIPNGWGIMLDDVLAGGYSAVALTLVYLFIGVLQN